MTQEVLNARLVKVFTDANAVYGSLAMAMNALARGGENGLEGCARLSEQVCSELVHVDAYLHQLTHGTVELLNDVEDALLAEESLEEEP